MGKVRIMSRKCLQQISTDSMAKSLQQLEIKILNYVTYGAYAGYADLRRFGFHILVYL